jgi:hypothetical protein
MGVSLTNNNMSVLIQESKILDELFLEESKLQERRVELEKFLQCIKGNKKLGFALCTFRIITYNENDEIYDGYNDEHVKSLFFRMMDNIFSGDQEVNGKKKHWNNGFFGSRWYDDRNTYKTCRASFFSKKTTPEWKNDKAYVITFTFEPRSKSTCAECKKQDHGYKKCSGCEVTRYCSVECQRKHWKTHKPICKEYQELENEEKE